MDILIGVYAQNSYNKYMNLRRRQDYDLPTVSQPGPSDGAQVCQGVVLRAVPVA